MAGALTVAAYICNRYKKEFNRDIDEMKLHKLMYFAQRESLVQTEETLFRGTFTGAKYGPILMVLREPYLNGELFLMASKNKISKKYIQEMQDVMDVVFKRYAEKSSMSLCRLSQGEFSWKQSRRNIPLQANSDNAMQLKDIRQDARRIKERQDKLKRNKVVEGV